MNDQLRRRAGILSLLLTTTLIGMAQEDTVRAAFDTQHIPAYIVAAILITIFTLIYFNRLYFYQQKKVMTETMQLNKQLTLIMSSNKLTTWTYDIEDDLFKVFDESGSKETAYTSMEFSLFFDHEDFPKIIKAINSVKEQQVLSSTVIVKNAIKEGDKMSAEHQLTYEVNITVLRHDKLGQPTVLLGTQQDITEKKAHLENNKEMTMKFHNIFNSSQIDMIYYNQDGILTDINEKAMETFGIEDRQKLLDRHVSFNDIPSYRGFDMQTMEQVHLSSITDIEQVKKEDERIPEMKNHRKIYYEEMVSPIRDEENRTLGVLTAGRDITEMVESNQQQKEASLLIEKVTKDIQQYIQSINYALKVSNVRMMKYDPYTHVLELSNEMNNVEFSLSQLRTMFFVHPEDRHMVSQKILSMDNRNPGSFSFIIRTVLKDKQHRDVYLNISMMPIEDKTGRISHYFGMCQDRTDLMHTELKLQEETAKAQEAESLKNTFLLNMSYELRTPLNAVIGFARLFGAEHDEADEPVFAEEIKNNTSVLLELINDILFLSRLDANMIEFNYQESDFAMLFEGWCHAGWVSLAPEVKKVIENPYNQLQVKIEPQQLATAIQKLCNYSTLVTREGMVRAKYEYRHGELAITIEDTSEGMDQKRAAHAFDRFTHQERGKEGTGLDLPIAKELIDQMNGTVELQSEPGKGNTFLVSIPCEMVSIEKKAEIAI